MWWVSKKHTGGWGAQMANGPPAHGTSLVALTLLRATLGSVSVFPIGLLIAGPSQSISYSTWIPGRALHVRITGYTVAIDVLATCQWVLQDRQAEQTRRNRTRLWSQLARMLATVPQRNVLVIAGDINTTCQIISGHVGSGVLTQTPNMDSEFMDLIRTFDLWGRARASRCATFINGDNRSQIVFILVRRRLVDDQARAAGPIDLNLAPWRLGVLVTSPLELAFSL